jgi:threonine aldolase
MLGGGMRQAGVLAAAGILALTEQVEPLRTDHKNAGKLAHALKDLPGLDIDLGTVETNMVFARLTRDSRLEVIRRMRDEGVLLHGFRDVVRLVTHFDFSEEQIEPVAAAFSRVLGPA